MVIRFLNPATTDLEKSYLLNPYSVGTTTIQVKNSDRFVANDRVMLGEMGQEKTEIVTVSNVAADGNTLTVGATVFAHSADDPIYKLRFDQAKFYRSTTGINGTYTVISTQALDVDNANLETIYDDTTGLSTYYYKTTAFHSVSLVESDYSDELAGSGWRREQVGNIIDEILAEVSDQQELNITRTEMLGYFNDVNDDLLTQVAKPYSFLHTRTTLNRTLNRNYIDFPVDADGKQIMWKFDRMDYNYTDATTSPATDTTTTITVIGPEEFRNTYSDNTISTTTTSDAKPEVMTLDTSVNRFRFANIATTTLANVFYLHYWKYFDTITSEGNIIETPTPKIYKLYCKSMYYAKRAISDVTMQATADNYMGQYNIEKFKLKGADRKDQGTPRSFSIPNATIHRFRR